MSLQKLEQIFSREGLLSRVLAPEYEWRPQQHEMATAVYRTLQEGGKLLVEAPTGVGKSLAYLVPGILWALESRRPILVSTYTRGLQDQILDKDLFHVGRLIDRSFRVAVLKGRGNYLCRNRWAHYCDEVRGTVEGEDLERALAAWVLTTETGDLSEAPLPQGKPGYRIQSAFARICGEFRFCSTGRCTPESGCFFKLSRQVAAEANLVIVNHALLLVDLVSEAAGLPEWSAVVVDEGHHLPRVAAEPLSFSTSESALESVLRGLGGRGDPGLTDHLRRALRPHPRGAARTGLQAALRDLETETGRLSFKAQGFWNELKALPSFPPPDQRLRFGPTAPWRELFPAAGLELCTELAAHLGHIRERLDEVRALRGSGGEGALFPLLEAERQFEEAERELHGLEELLTPDRTDFVYWIEPATPSGVTLKAAPLEVGPFLRESLFLRKESVILTSATLALQGRFDHLARKLGLRGDEFEGLILPTPFRLEEQVGAWIVTGIPGPNEPGFPQALADGVELLARRLRRKILVLFTSHETLRQVEALLRVPLEERGIRLLAQGLDGGHRAVRAGFQEQGPAVLLGAASFWEGVDFPGEELEILLMARLPFLVPTDPRVEAIGERLQSEGLRPFEAFHLPEALIRFRQGFGRLIRRAGDRGLFVVVDPRLELRHYGSLFKDAVGVPFRAATTWEEMAGAGESWLQNPGK